MDKYTPIDSNSIEFINPHIQGGRVVDMPKGGDHIRFMRPEEKIRFKNGFMKVEDLIDLMRDEYRAKYYTTVSPVAMQYLLDDVARLIYLCFRFKYSRNYTDDIHILLNTRKFTREIIERVSDDWVSYVVGELGFDPNDATMITPF